MLSNCTAAFVTLATSNFDKLVSFYTEFLQQKPQMYRQNVYTEFQIAGLRLGIFQPGKSNNAEFANSRSSSMSLCLEVENLESAIAQITNIGYPPPGEIVTASHGKEIYAYDPDGNRLILHQS